MAEAPDWAREHEGRIGDQITRLRVAVMDRIDRLQNLVEAMRDAIGVNFSGADRVEDVARGATREVQALAAEVSAMERQIRRLQADVQALKDQRPS